MMDYKSPLRTFTTGGTYSKVVQIKAKSECLIVQTRRMIIHQYPLDRIKEYYKYGIKVNIRFYQIAHLYAIRGILFGAYSQELRIKACR